MYFVQIHLHYLDKRWIIIYIVKANKKKYAKTNLSA